MQVRRSIIPAVALSLSFLTACGTSPPPADELALELIDTLDVSDAVKACMKDEVNGFTLTEEQQAGFKSLDDVADKADGGNEQALAIMADFQAALAACN